MFTRIKRLKQLWQLIRQQKGGVPLHLMVMLPCPFCGSDNVKVYHDDIDGWIAHVSCHDCDDMQGPTSKFKYDDRDEAAKDAINQWNRREA